MKCRPGIDSRAISNGLIGGFGTKVVGRRPAKDAVFDLGVGRSVAVGSRYLMYEIWCAFCHDQPAAVRQGACAGLLIAQKKPIKNQMKTNRFFKEEIKREFYKNSTAFYEYVPCTQNGGRNHLVVGKQSVTSSLSQQPSVMLLPGTLLGNLSHYPCWRDIGIPEASTVP